MVVYLFEFQWNCNHETTAKIADIMMVLAAVIPEARAAQLGRFLVGRSFNLYGNNIQIIVSDVTNNSLVGLLYFYVTSR